MEFRLKTPQSVHLQYNRSKKINHIKKAKKLRFNLPIYYYCNAMWMETSNAEEQLEECKTIAKKMRDGIFKMPLLIFMRKKKLKNLRKTKIGSQFCQF
jgi:hypothetical protein